MSRSTQSLARVPAAAFDFDVVTDVPPRPARKPEPAPDPARSERSATESARSEAAE